MKPRERTATGREFLSHVFTTWISSRELDQYIRCIFAVHIIFILRISIVGANYKLKQQNCKYSSHVLAKVITAKKSLFVLGSLRKEGMSQEEVDHLFNAIVLPNFSYALPVYGASDSDLSVIQNFLDRCMKRKFMSKNVNIRDLLEKADKTLYKKRSNDPECPFFQFLPKEKNMRYNLRNTSVSVPRIYTDRFKNVFSNRIIFRCDM